jgi:hypothetical protein
MTPVAMSRPEQTVRNRACGHHNGKHPHSSPNAIQVVSWSAAMSGDGNSGGPRGTQGEAESWVGVGWHLRGLGSPP